jgi:fatty-acyl-CoA synthase
VGRVAAGGDRAQRRRRKGKLAPYKTVKAVEFVDEIPRNPSGKILKRELRERFSEVADRGS